MYEFAETKGAYRHTLPQIRAGEYEKVAERIVTPEWEPDFGPAGNQSILLVLYLMLAKNGLEFILKSNYIIIAFNCIVISHSRNIINNRFIIIFWIFHIK